MVGAARAVAGAAAATVEDSGAATAPTVTEEAVLVGAEAPAEVGSTAGWSSSRDGRRTPKLVATALIAEREEANACCSTSSLVSDAVATASTVRAAVGTAAAAACIAAVEVATAATAGSAADKSAVVDCCAPGTEVVMAGAAAAPQKRMASKPPRDCIAVI